MPLLLAVIPHPDDEAYSFAGSIALAARAGWRCVVHCASAGEHGQRHDGGEPAPAALAAARIAELHASCDLLGAEPPVCWNLPDGGLAGIPLEATPLPAVLASLRPDVILALGADGAYGHPDHLAVYGWVRQAWHTLPAPRPALLFAAFPPALFLPQWEKCRGMMGDPPQPPPSAIGATPWHIEVDTTSVASIKLASIAAHRTQLPGGDPETLFPPGIVRALLVMERFTDEFGPKYAPTSTFPENAVLKPDG